MLARCPNCRNTFSTDRTGRQDCPVCGKPLVVPEQAVAAQPLPPPPGASEPEAEGTPWERREELGAWPAFYETLKQALLEPGRLFQAARLDRGGAQAGFAMLLGIPVAISQIVARALYNPDQSDLQKYVEQITGRPLDDVSKSLLASHAASSWGWTIALALLAPAFLFLFVYLNAGITHLFALLFGQNKRGFAATFAACAYAFAPLVLTVIPGCGGIIALLWVIVLTAIGLKETHRASAGGATAAVIAPYFLCCCAFSLAIAVGAAAVAHRMHP